MNTKHLVEDVEDSGEFLVYNLGGDEVEEHTS